VLNTYLKGEPLTNNLENESFYLYPFGVNRSQKQAVESIFKNQLDLQNKCARLREKRSRLMIEQKRYLERYPRQHFDFRRWSFRKNWHAHKEAKWGRILTLDPAEKPFSKKVRLISTMSDPTQILGPNIILTGGIAALGNGSGKAKGWAKGVQIIPDPDMLSGKKIPPWTPMIIDVRIMHYSVTSSFSKNPKEEDPKQNK
jgi:hypothetical protein